MYKIWPDFGHACAEKKYKDRCDDGSKVRLWYSYIACNYGINAEEIQGKFSERDFINSTLRLAAFTAEVQNNCQLEQSCKAVRAELERAELRLMCFVLLM